MKKLLCLLFALALFASFCGAGSAEEAIVFTVQPKGGETTNEQYFTFTWEATGNGRYMLQSREDETYNWGNIDWITSPHSMENSNYQAQYRIMAVRESDGAEFFSDPFTVRWKPADDLTRVTLEDVSFADLPLGYAAPDALPIRVTNIGDKTLREPRVFMGDGGEEYFEIVVNKQPKDLPAGATDSETWSIRPKPGLGVGWYHELFYLGAANIETYASAAADLNVTPSDVEITYRIDANDVDFGVLRKGYRDVADIDLVVRAAGTGNLTKVHLMTEEDGQRFFSLKQNNGMIDHLTAGTGSRSNWYVVLNGGLEPGEYSETVKIYAAEVSEPKTVTVRVKIVGENDPIPDPQTPGGTDVAPSEQTGSFPLWTVIAGVAAVLIAVAALIWVRAKKKK